MIVDKLKTYDYYLNYLSLLMQNSFGIEDRCKTYVDILKNVDGLADTFYEQINIFDWEVNHTNLTITSDYSIDFLEKMADLFGITRTFNITYTDTNDILGEGTSEVTETITLSDYSLWLLTCLTVIKNNFTGTTKELRKLYNPSAELFGVKIENFNLSSAMKEISDLKILYTWNNTSNSLFANIYMINAVDYANYKGNTGKQIVKLFLAGKLTIESVGITYNKLTDRNLLKGLFYDEDETTSYDAMKFYDSTSAQIKHAVWY